jgi:membrane-bound acyltransferase YfiQ involved in biofilm formation
MFSFVIGDKSETFFLEADEVTQHEKLLKFWEKYRLWIIIAIAAIILIIILISYVKTSRGR